MNLGLNFRRGVAALPEALEMMVARINTVWKKQHADDGGHQGVTTDSLTVTGNTLTGPLRVEGKIESLPPYPDATDRVCLEFGESVSFLPPTRAMHLWSRKSQAVPAPSLDKTIADLSLDARVIRAQRGGGAVYLNFAPGRVTATPELTTQIAGQFDGVVNILSGSTEYGRAAKLGDWTAVPYVAGNFTAGGGGTWTVPVGNIQLNHYTLVGHTMLWQFRAFGTTIAGVVTDLRITLPAGKSATLFFTAPTSFLTDGAGVPFPGMCEGVGAPTLRVLKTNPFNGAFAAGAVCSVYFSVQLAVNDA